MSAAYPLLRPEPTVEVALLELLAELKARHYAFVTPTPLTHSRVVARDDRREARNVRDIFGWSLPFARDLLDTHLFDALHAADAIEAVGESLWRSTLRVSSYADDLFLHSAYPTSAHDAVFFGPDSYRFAEFIRSELGDVPTGAHVVDIGTGSGIGVIVAGRLLGDAELSATDLNPAALALARINAQSASVAVNFVLGSDLSAVSGAIDIAIANPPFIIDDAHRAYRDGGAHRGGEVSLRMARMAIERFSSEGRLLLYTASAIVDGDDPLRRALGELANEHGCSVGYRELDPDVFGEELEREAYRDIERIAIVGAVVSRAGSLQCSTFEALRTS